MHTGIQDNHVRALAEFITSSSFQRKFEQFFLDNALMFTDEDEHQLEYTTLYQNFQKLFNEHMEVFLLDQGITEEEFEKKCQQAMENDPKADQYLEIVLASMDYDAFYHLMKAMRGRAAAERVAESKASSREEQDETKPTSKTTTTSVTSSIANKNERHIGSKLTLDQSEDPQKNRIEDAKEQDKEEKKNHDIKEIISQSKEEK